MDGADGPRAVDLVERELRVGLDLFRRLAFVAQLKGERHAEAAGMRGGDQFLGVGALAITKARGERIGRFFERFALRGQGASPFLDGASPNGGGSTVHGRLL